MTARELGRLIAELPEELKDVPIMAGVQTSQWASHYATLDFFAQYHEGHFLIKGLSWSAYHMEQAAKMRPRERSQYLAKNGVVE